MDPDDESPAPPGTYGLVRLLTVIAYVGALWAALAVTEEGFSLETAAIVTGIVLGTALIMGAASETQHSRRLWFAIAGGIGLGPVVALGLYLWALSQMVS